jgi:hypothetical protein
VVLPLLNMVPNKLICHPGGLFFSQFNVLKSGVMAYGKPLAAFAADHGFHQDCGRGKLREPPKTSGNSIRVHQRCPRR